MEIFNPGWNFNLLNRVEISSRLNSKLLFKMTLQLQVKISTRFSQPEMKFQPGIKIPDFPYSRHFFQSGMKIWYFACVSSLFIFKKIKMATYKHFWFSLLTFIKFSIYLRLLYFNLRWNFLQNCNFFQLGIPSWNFNPGWKSPYNQTLNQKGHEVNTHLKELCKEKNIYLIDNTKAQHWNKGKPQLNKRRYNIHVVLLLVNYLGFWIDNVIKMQALLRNITLIKQILTKKVINWHYAVIT